MGIFRKDKLIGTAVNPSDFATKDELDAKADVDYAQKKLYCHNMMLRFNDGNRKLKVSIITSRAEAYTVAALTQYLKANYSSTNANITGNLTCVIPGCMGYYKDSSNNWYDMLGLAFSSDYNAVCPVGRLQTATASNQLSVLNSHSGTYTVTDNVISLND